MDGSDESWGWKAKSHEGSWEREKDNSRGFGGEIPQWESGNPSARLFRAHPKGLLGKGSLISEAAGECLGNGDREDAGDGSDPGGGEELILAVLLRHVGISEIIWNAWNTENNHNICVGMFGIFKTLANSSEYLFILGILKIVWEYLTLEHSQHREYLK